MTNSATGLAAEQSAAAALRADGFTMLGQRLRTAAGEIDLVASRPGLLVFVEVKHRPTLAGAAHALTPRQQARLQAAAEILLAEHPDWAQPEIRFDVILTDATGQMRRIKDALRLM